MKRGIFSTLLAVFLIAAVFVLPIVNYRLTYKEAPAPESVDKANKNIVSNNTDDDNIADTDPIPTNEKVTYIVTLEGESLIDTVINSKGKYKNVNELILSDEGKQYCDTIKKNQAIVKASVQQLVSGSDFSECKTYSAVMNGFTVNASADSMEKLKKINGIKAVEVIKERDYFFANENSSELVSTAEVQSENQIEDTEEKSVSDTAYSSKLSSSFRSMINASAVNNEGYTGKGMLIAVIDSEFNTKHNFFSAYPESCALTSQELSQLYSKTLFNTNPDYGYDSLYISPKIGFAYDYACDNTVTADENLEHGTAVAAAAAGNNGKDGIDEYKGIAYDSQLALMKVAKERDDCGKIYAETPDVIAALDDSVKLGADIINISFGYMRSSENKKIYQPIIEKINNIGIYVVCASGNESFNGSSFTSSDYPYASDIDYGTENYLAGIDGVITVGSTDNIVYEKRYFSVGNKEIFYTDISKKKLCDLGETNNKTLQYIYLDADGRREDYSDIDTANKLVIINKSEMEADEIYNIAEEYSAAALAVIDDDKAEDALLSVSSGSIPFVIIENKDASFFQENPSGNVKIGAFGKLYYGEDKRTVSADTSYGMTLSSQLSSRVLACGEQIFSASANGDTDFYNGSSFAASSVSGACALIKQYINNNNSKYTEAMNADAVKAVLLSTSEPIEYGKNTLDEQLYISPRLQGSGVMNIDHAVNTAAFVTNINGKAFSENIGSSKSGEYEFEFEIHNLSSYDRSYEISYALQTDRHKSDSSEQAVNTLKPYSLYSKSDVKITVKNKSVKSVTVKKGETIKVNVKIKLEEAEMKKLMQYFTNGFYVDGYIFLYNREDNIKLNAPFNGFCGEPEKLDPFNKLILENDENETEFKSRIIAVAENGSVFKSCELSEENGKIYFSRNIVKNVLENNSYGSAFILPDFYFLRDVYDLTVTVSDINGEAVFSCNLGNISAYRDSSCSPYERLVKNSLELETYFSGLADGKYKYKLSAKTSDPNGKLSESFEREYDLIVESVKPTDVKSRTYTENNRIYLDLSAKDNTGITDFKLYAAAYDSEKQDYSYADRLEEIVAAGYMSNDAYELVDKKINSDGTAVFKYDITNLSLRLVSLKLRTSTWVNKSSSLKIAYKAVDLSGNESEAKTADTIIYGSAEFTFTDQNGKPAKNITVELDGIRKTTDKSGNVVFDRIKPDYYIAYIFYDDQLYKLQNDRQLFEISNSSPNYKFDEKVEFIGEYIEEESEASDKTDNSFEDKRLAFADKELSESQDTENPVYAFAFVGGLLLVGIVTLVIRRKKSF